jgi:hypothetical protein
MTQYGKERAVLMLWRAEVAQLARLATELLHEVCNEAGLADPRLTDEQHHTTVATLRLKPALRESVQLLISPQQRRQGCRRMERLGAAAVNRGRDLPGRNLLGETLHCKGSQILAIEQAVDLPVRRGIDHKGARPGSALQAGGEIRRSPDCRRLPNSARSNESAHDYQTGGDPYSNLERRRSGRRFGDSLDDSQGSTDSLFGI